MRIQPLKFALAASITALILWFFCSLLVWWQPQFMMAMSGEMFHLNMASVEWNMSVAGVVKGGILWAVFAAIFAWLLAYLYNVFSEREQP